MSINTKLVQTPAVSLYSGMAIDDTSCIITPYPVDLDGNQLTMTEFGTNPTFTVDPKILSYEEINGFTGIIDNGNNTATLTGLTRNLIGKYPYTVSSSGGKTHGSSAVVVFSDNPQVYARFAAKDNDETITGQWTFNTFPITPATPLATNLAAGMTKLSVAAVSALNPIAVGDNDIRVPTANPTTLFAPISAVAPTGVMSPYAGYAAPASWALCDGSAISRLGANAALFALLCPSGTFTVTIATPAVFTKVAHGFKAGDQLHFTTTGGLPSGLSLNTTYFVLSTSLTTDTFKVALSPEGVVVNTTGTQSGIHTLYRSNFGKGDGSTTFNVPDLRSRLPLAIGNFTRTYLFEGDSTIVNTGADTIAVTADCGLYQGQPVVLTGSAVPTGVTTATTYYVIRSSNTALTIQLASSQALANSGTAVNITATGSGLNTLTYTAPSTQTIIGKNGGEETHGISITELASHTHPSISATQGSGAAALNFASAGGSAGGSTGGDVQHNNTQPFMSVTYIIKL